MMALMLVSSLSILLSGAAAATTGQQTTSDHQGEDCTNVDVQSGRGDHEKCDPDQCPDLAVQTGGGGGHDDCDTEECPDVAVQTGGGHDDCDSEECPDLAVQTGGGHDDCDTEECPDLAAMNGGGDHQDDEDCDSEECPDVGVQNGDADEGDDEDCTPTTSTTTTTTLPSIAPDELELTAIGAECFSDIPYLRYAIDFPGGQSATITFLNPTGADVVYEDVPLSGAVLWPGANDSPPDWPGWILQDGVWVAADDGFLWARGNISVLFEVNPSTVLTVSYPQATEACADPENIPDVVGGVVITPPTTPSQIGGVEVLPFTGIPGGALAAVAFAALALGGLMVLSARRDEADES